MAFHGHITTHQLHTDSDLAGTLGGDLKNEGSPYAKVNLLKSLLPGLAQRAELLQDKI